MIFPWKTAALLLLVFVCYSRVEVCYGQDYDDEKKAAPPPNPAFDMCSGIFLTYSFQGRDKEYPHVKNVSAQAWAFKAEASVTNQGDEELKGWKMYIGFQHREILVSASGAVPIDVEDFPAAVGNGTTLAGNPMTDLKTAIETASDYNQMQVRIQLTGTQFGLKTGTPMPKTIRLENDGYKCPAARRRGTEMYVCCKKDPKAKAKKNKSKFLPRTYGDITIAYDVLQSFKTNYMVQVTIDNNHPLSRLDHWNLTWEWQNGEFINSIRGAYSHLRDPSECLYGPAGKYYADFDFSQVANCQKKPVLSDLPAERKEDEKVGKLPWCCRNGTVLPPIMDKNKARSLFQMQVYKMPPLSDNSTAISPPLKWHLAGVLQPEFKCGPPIRVDPQEFPDPNGLQAISTAVASWQIVCNVTKPKPKENKCCVSFSAFYGDSAIPCNTCACGCEETRKCDPNARPMLIPPEALLVPFVNRTAKARAWAKIKHMHIPKKLPCGDNCPVSINWHVNTDHKNGWTARITLFNWEDFTYDDWFTAVSFKRSFENYEAVYSFNGTRIPNLKTIFFQGFKGMNYLAGETNGTHHYDPKVPGKQQSVISFNKKRIKNFDIRHDGFPTKVIFNGQECALPPRTPAHASSAHRSSINVLALISTGLITFLLMKEPFY
ncbi:hypothetical protein L6164_022471 [Bauhinia variegata]|uniref:Uncharacterized protein n=1 Tax=Bauhinia variegata TaxID=167791 RepID=A0ACB9MFC3_BAUVA|nr:hypothetical protein L6164_022471 [Bauhinia variegata]